MSSELGGRRIEMGPRLALFREEYEKSYSSAKMGCLVTTWAPAPLDASNLYTRRSGIVVTLNDKYTFGSLRHSNPCKKSWNEAKTIY